MRIFVEREIVAPVFVHRARGHQVTRLRHRWSRLARRCRPRRDLDADQLAPRNPSAAPGSVGRSVAPWLRAVGSIDLLLAINRVKIARDARSEPLGDADFIATTDTVAAMSRAQATTTVLADFDTMDEDKRVRAAFAAREELRAEVRARTVHASEYRECRPMQPR